MSGPATAAPSGRPASRRRPSIFVRPRVADPDVARNWAGTQREALNFGAMEGIVVFLPVLLTRLGASELQLGLLTALPNVAILLLAIPLGGWLQRRRNAVPWYAHGRLIGHLSYAVVGLALILMPSAAVIPVILAIVGIAAIFHAFADLSFWAVMDGVAGPGGRFELIGHRFGLKGAANATTQATIGQVLSRLAFPIGYQLVFVASAIPAIVGFRYSRTFRIPDNPPMPDLPPLRLHRRALGLLAEVAREGRFLAFVGSLFSFRLGFRMAAPLLPLWYVHELGVSDGFIGVLGTVQALAVMAGYFSWRRPARRIPGRWILLPCGLAMAAFPGIVALIHDELLILPVVAVYGIGYAGFDLAVFDELMRTVPRDRVVRFTSLDTGVENLAGVIGPLLGAVVAGAIGIAAGLVLSAAVGIAGAVLLGAAAFSRARAAGE